jgi:hypothetical protein
LIDVEEDVVDTKSHCVLIATEQDLTKLGSRGTSSESEMKRVTVQIATDVLFNIDGTHVELLGT